METEERETILFIFAEGLKAYDPHFVPFFTTCLTVQVLWWCKEWMNGRDNRLLEWMNTAAGFGHRSSTVTVYHIPGKSREVISWHTWLEHTNTVPVLACTPILGWDQGGCWEESNQWLWSRPAGPSHFHTHHHTACIAWTKRDEK